VKDTDKHQLEGLLQARSEDMGHGRRPRSRRVVATPTFEPPALESPAFEPPAPPAAGQWLTSSARSCEECGAPISTRRVRAMPRTTRCLDCQRSAEQAGIRS
jgi:Prokaryotic dksA/traR C4-type zinc finger